MGRPRRGRPILAGMAGVGLISVHTSPLEQPGTGDSGGMNVYLAQVARRLAARGSQVHVFTRAAGADLPPTVVTDDGVAVHHLQAGPPGLGKADLANHLCAFYLAFAAHPVPRTLDLLHAHYWMSGWVGRKARQRLGLPLVATFHTLGRVKNDTLAPGDTPEPALRLTAEDRVVADADALIAPTATEAALLRGRYGARPEAVTVVEPGVDLALFDPAQIDRHAARQALGGGRIVLFAGRLQPLKGPDLAVRTLAALDRLLPDDGIPTRLVIVGGASGNGAGTVDPPALRRLAAGLGVADRVALLTARPQEELAVLYRAADAVLVPSWSESFGLVALEAQATGTPVVAADVSGLRHVLSPGSVGPGSSHASPSTNGADAPAVPGGTLVAGHDPAAFAAALVPYLVDARMRAAAGAAGRRMASGRGWDRTAEGVLAVYRRVLAARDHATLLDASTGA
jgi:D-inositol-3-phosphate glycosyltransferase